MSDTPARHRYPVAVHLFFFQDERVLLLRRFNTGWQDGKYSVPAGHVEAGESVTAAAIREAGEELGVCLKPEMLEVIHVMHRKSNDERVDFFLPGHAMVRRHRQPRAAEVRRSGVVSA